MDNDKLKKLKRAEYERNRRNNFTPEQKQREAARKSENYRKRQLTPNDSDSKRLRTAQIHSQQDKENQFPTSKQNTCEASMGKQTAAERVRRPLTNCIQLNEMDACKDISTLMKNGAHAFDPTSITEQVQAGRAVNVDDNNIIINTDQVNSSAPDPRSSEASQICRLRIPLHSNYAGRNVDIHPKEHDIGPKNAVCQFCCAIHFQAEKTTRGKFSTCCAGGSIEIPECKTYPEKLLSWLSNNDEESKHFRLHIRQYNSAVAFASFGHHPIKFPRGPPVYVIHGQVYHRASVSAESLEKPSYAQLYILDPQYANEKRMSNEQNHGCQLDVMTYLDTFLRNNNPYAKAYMMMSDVLRAHDRTATIQMWITKDRCQDPRRYNLPVANEVAAVFVSEDGEPPFNRDICVHSIHDGKLQNIPIYSPNCDPMTYPLLFPYGDSGWQPRMAKKCASNNNENGDEADGNNLSMLQFYSYRLQDRRNFSPLLHAAKLTQQFIVDAFLKVEGQRLQWNAQNQKQLRVELYLGLMDYVNNIAEQRELKAGKIAILPSSFTGGKRAMQQNYQDAMMIVAKFGRPDLFITFTCNPTWKEITSALAPYETALDRPDLVATVFHLKLKEFMKDMTRKGGGILGNVKAYLSVIEFQKRGLPHCHMLFILEDQDKLTDPNQVDTVVCAEIPDEEDSTLFNIIKTCMLHGPCGEHNKNAPCMDEIKGIHMCTKKFPKEYCEQTNVSTDGYPLYQRRNNGRKVLVRNAELDNRWVVPYNPYLSRKYNAHINVEVSSSIQCVKYIFKYIYKGHDAAIVKVSEGSENGTLEWDEVQSYINTRYISAPEAVWRLRKYEMSSRSHAIERLPVHLPAQEVVVFEEGNEEQALRQAEKRGTKLTKWFQLNRDDPEARNLLYTEIPYNYVWSKNHWRKRKVGGNKILARMYSVSPKDIERFCLRLLLMHVKGAVSYEDLRTVNGICYETFKEAAVSLNLLDDDKEWYKTMDEAVIFRMPSELRMLFAIILIFGEVSDNKSFYETYKCSMFEDFLLDHSAYMAEQLSLKDIQEHLQQFGKDCASFNLPAPTDAYDLDGLVDVVFERNEAESMKNVMNAEQKEAYDTIIAAINGRRREKCFFLSGAGGCGKTFIYKALTCHILGEGGKVKAVAPTGLAATLLKSGRTVHSGFGIPIDLNEKTVSRFTQRSKEYKELLNTKLIIWDEISMCHVHLLNAVDRSLRDLMNNSKPFGGITIVVGGDFRQQAPVVLHGNRVKIVESCVKSSKVWKEFKELKLLKNMRVNCDEIEFAKWLLTIGSGHAEKLEGFCMIPKDKLADDIVQAVFGDDINSLSHADLASRAILCPKNADTLSVNETILAKIHGTLTTYYSIDDIVNCESEEERAQYPLEFLHSITPMGMPPHVLNLKKGCCVMLLRNLNPRQGLCNGTRLIVESLSPNLIECSIFSGSLRGQKVFIPRIRLDCRNTDLPFEFRRKQFPLRLAYSMTITKSQGQTFERIGVYLPEPVFTHGQLYTAFSRVRSKNGLFVKIIPGSRQGYLFEGDDDVYTYNCVYKEIL